MPDSPSRRAVSLATVVAHNEVAWASAGSELVVQTSVATHVLDPTAAVLWQCLDGVSPLRDVFVDIADVFQVPVDEVAADCVPAIESWLATGIAVDRSLTTHGTDDGFSHGRSWRRLVDPPNT